MAPISPKNSEETGDWYAPVRKSGGGPSARTAEQALVRVPIGATLMQAVAEYGRGRDAMLDQAEGTAGRAPRRGWSMLLDVEALGLSALDLSRAWWSRRWPPPR